MPLATLETDLPAEAYEEALRQEEYEEFYDEGENKIEVPVDPEAEGYESILEDLETAAEEEYEPEEQEEDEDGEGRLSGVKEFLDGNTGGLIGGAVAGLGAAAGLYTAGVPLAIIGAGGAAASGLGYLAGDYLEGYPEGEEGVTLEAVDPQEYGEAYGEPDQDEAEEAGEEPEEAVEEPEEEQPVEEPDEPGEPEEAEEPEQPKEPEDPENEPDPEAGEAEPAAA